MTWTAPHVDRADPVEVAPERAALEGWLRFHRETLLMKCAGLSAEQLCVRAVPPSTLSLLGLVRHMREVERSWFLRGFAGLDRPPVYYSDDNRDGDFDDADPQRAEDDVAAFMIEEYARHNGHADLLRECIDGVTGD